MTRIEAEHEARLDREDAIAALELPAFGPGTDEEIAFLAWCDRVA